MSPNHSFMFHHHHSSATLKSLSTSRTYQYRKIMKPMLERKRRARINKCLDELKELMGNYLQSEGENVAKLEKADILELTVRHLHNLREKSSLHLRQDRGNTESYWEGFRHCANEVSKFLFQYDKNIGSDLLTYINRKVNQESEKVQASTPRVDGCLLNSVRYDNFVINHNSSILAEVKLPKLPLRTVEQNNGATNVWRPW